MSVTRAINRAVDHSPLYVGIGTETGRLGRWLDDLWGRIGNVWSQRYPEGGDRAGPGESTTSVEPAMPPASAIAILARVVDRHLGVHDAYRVALPAARSWR